MRVLLVQPTTGGEAATAATLAGSEHLGLGYVAAGLEASGHAAEILDLQASGLSVRATARRVVRGRYGIVGMSPTSASAPNAIELVRAIKRSAPDVAIVWGGHLATGLRERAFSVAPRLDAVVAGQGEQVMPLIVDAIAASGALPRHGQVLVNPRGGRVVRTVEPRRLRSWLELEPVRPLPPEFYERHGARVVTSLGCRFDCTFCTTPFFSGRRVQRRAHAHVVRELERLARELRVARVWMNDDLFVDGSPTSRRWARRFAGMLRRTESTVRFRAMCRADTFSREPELIDELVGAGLDAMFVGLESGDDAALRELNKRTSVASNVAIARELARRGVLLQPGFIMFTHRATLDGLRRSVRFLTEIGELYRLFPVTRTSVAFPGTELWDTLHADEAVDPERSTEFVAHARFEHPAVRELSVAFERLEEHFAPLDSRLYRARADGRLGGERRSALNRTFARIVLDAIDRAEHGADADRLERDVLGRRGEIEAVAGAL